MMAQNETLGTSLLRDEFHSDASMFDTSWEYYLQSENRETPEYMQGHSLHGVGILKILHRRRQRSPKRTPHFAVYPSYYSVTYGNLQSTAFCELQ